MEKQKISILMPVYNGEKYLLYSLYSVTKQTYLNIEIIIVDDGSVDSSESVIRSFNDYRIMYFSQDNKGKNSALNLALKHASGDYIIVFDQDDYMVEDYLEELSKLIVVYNADCAVGNFDIVKDYCSVVHKPLKKQPFEITTEDNIMDVFFSKNKVALWLYLFKREILDNFSWPEEYTIDDLPTSYKLISKCERVVYSDVAVYLHYENPSSMTRDISRITSQEYNLQLVNIYAEIYNFSIDINCYLGKKFVINRMVLLSYHFKSINHLDFINTYKLIKHNRNGFTNRIKLLLIKFNVLMSKNKAFDYIRRRYLLYLLTITVTSKNKLNELLKHFLNKLNR